MTSRAWQRLVWHSSSNLKMRRMKNLLTLTSLRGACIWKKLPLDLFLWGMFAWFSDTPCSCLPGCAVRVFKTKAARENTPSVRRGQLTGSDLDAF